MNILPKKSWHVRNKDNVARVRRDEAKALEEEQEVARRKAYAEREARIRMLREKSKVEQSSDKTDEWTLPQEPAASDDESNAAETDHNINDDYTPLNTAFPLDKHFNLFEEFEAKKKSQGTNREYEEEKRKAQEAYEKKIGYLTYLGQSASGTANKQWYEKVPTRGGEGDTSVQRTYSEQEAIDTADPLLSMKGFLDKKKLAEDVYYGRVKEVSTEIEKKPRKRKRAEDTSLPVSRTNMTTDTVRTQSASSDQTKHKKEKKKKKDKKSKKSKTSVRDKSPQPKKPTIEELRAARNEREAAERHRSIELVSRLQGYSTPARSVIDERSLKYNTVYMPKHRHH